jgi:hypothetical protein
MKINYHRNDSPLNNILRLRDPGFFFNSTPLFLGIILDWQAAEKSY